MLAPLIPAQAGIPSLRKMPFLTCGKGWLPASQAVSGWEGYSFHTPLTGVPERHSSVALRFVNLAFPNPVPIVSTPQRSTSCMNGTSLSPWTTASLCSTIEDS